MAGGRLWRVALAGLAAVASAGPEWKHQTTKPALLCGVPMYAYRATNELAPPVTALSLSGVLAEQVPGLPTGAILPPDVRVRYFQLAVQRLQIDHCFLSRVALSLHDDGTVILSLRADQNPRLIGDPSEPVPFPIAAGRVLQQVPSPTRFESFRSTPRQLDEENQRLAPRSLEGEVFRQTSHLRRNKFLIRVRLYGGYPLREDAPNIAPGKPVLFEVAPPAFWVQSAEPYDLHHRERRPEASQYFHLIDRVEVEFTYR